VHARYLEIDDRPHVRLRQPVEHDDLVEAVQELGPEMPAHHGHYLVLHVLHGLVVAE
jgi:hypothetical protein